MSKTREIIDARLTVRLPEDLIARLAKVAVREGRTVSDVVRRILEAKVRGAR
jgi:predicted DNA-binding protein